MTPGKRLGAAQRWQIAKEYRDGASLNAVSREHGIGKERAKAIIERYGVALRVDKRQPRDVLKDASMRVDNPRCCYCGLRLELVRIVHDSDDGRCCDMCYHHVNGIRRSPQGTLFWSEKGLSEQAAMDRRRQRSGRRPAMARV